MSRRALDRTLGPASGRVHVVLVNQSDLPNGWATPVPYNLIEISAAGPDGESTIANADDWLRLVFTHEYYAHRSPGPISWMDRRPPAGVRTKPGALPQSGVAARGRSKALQRSRRARRQAQGAGECRGLSPDSRARSIGVQIRADRSRRWWTRRLARRQRAVCVRRVVRSLPRRSGMGGHAAAPHRRDWQTAALLRSASLSTTCSADRSADCGRTSKARCVSAEQAEPAIASRLTHHGFTVSGPRFARDGRIYYSTVNPHGFPALMSLDPGAAKPREIATRIPRRSGGACRVGDCVRRDRSCGGGRPAERPPCGLAGNRQPGAADARHACGGSGCLS